MPNQDETPEGSAPNEGESIDKGTSGDGHSMGGSDTDGTDGTAGENAVIATDGQPEAKPVLVGIGASAGGLEALEHFFDNMPPDSGLSFVIIQHLSPDFKSLMNELLARHTKMQIFRAEDSMEIEPNCIYLITPKKMLAIDDGKLVVTEQDQGLNLPIDAFFSSLAAQQDFQSVAVVLSGTGSDGSRGVVDIHTAGGIVAIQALESAGFDGMPRSALRTGVAQITAPAWELPQEILRAVENPAAEPVPEDPSGEDEDAKPLDVIVQLFRDKYNVDFSHYRDCTIQRRIERRMQLVRKHSLSEYLVQLREDSTELEQLYRDLLVEVTQFFRDPKAFKRLENDVVPELVRRAAAERDDIRVWVAGCATGEEAYSIAMLLDTKVREADLPISIKVFATDVHHNSLEAGSTGVFRAESLQHLPEVLRKRYFNQHGTLFHISQELRKLVIFAPHNLISDPPFTRLDLISCRNVLIYLKPDVQRRVLSLFHFGLRVDGYMLLGSSESLGELSREFGVIDQHWRIFKKLRNVRLGGISPSAMRTPLSTALLPPSQPSILATRRYSRDSRNPLLDSLVHRLVPPSVVVNEQSEVLYTFGDAGKYFAQPKGRSTLEALRMVHGDLRMALSAAIHRASREDKRVALQGIRSEDGQPLLTITVDPIKQEGERLLLISIDEQPDERPPAAAAPEQFGAVEEAQARIVDLERELEFKTESLQTTVEELESSNEELQSTNEELVASNEELQSTNEELHSVNEELYTVNAEHQRKIDELTALTADMDNLIRSTEIATIFLDRKLRIRRFTPAITQAFNIIEQDIGRSIEQFAYHFEGPGWIDEVKAVIETGTSVKTELASQNDGGTYLKQVTPFRTNDGDIDGVVITFTDVTAVTRAADLEERGKHLERVNHDLQDFVYAVSHDMKTPMRHLQNSLAELNEQQGEVAATTHMQDSVSKLDRMLSALLQFSRVNTRGKAKVSVELGDIVDKVVEGFQPAIAEKQATIDAGPLPSLNADPEQLQTLIWHIVDNALKYSEDPPKLEISAEEKGESWVIAFRDHGIGVRPQHCDEIFVIFRRLEFKRDVPGEGSGLAFCRRIAERHQAKIWAEANKDGGTTFFLRWPKRNSDG